MVSEASAWSLRATSFATIVLVTAVTAREPLRDCEITSYVIDCSFLKLRNFDGVDSKNLSDKIDLANNFLQEFPDISSFRHANLAHNYLSTVNASVEFNLRVLDVTSNLITKIVLGENFKELQYLQAPGNFLFTNNYFIEGECKLSALDISNNSLKSLDPVLVCEELVTLDASKNNISVLPKNITTLKNLRRLYISHNSLLDLFQLPPGLETLDLSYNQLQVVPNLWKISNLTNLLLSHNAITLVTQNSTLNLLALLRVDLSANKLQAIDNSIDWTAHAKEMDLSNNSISNVPQEELKFWVHLEKLDLSDNKITVVPTFPQMWGIKFLSLANNLVENVSSAQVEALLGWGSENRFVDLRGNVLWNNQSQLEKLVRRFSANFISPTDPNCECLELSRGHAILALCISETQSSNGLHRFLEMVGNISCTTESVQSYFNSTHNSHKHNRNYNLTILLITVVFFLSVTVLVILLWSRSSLEMKKEVRIVTKYTKLQANDPPTRVLPEQVDRVRRSRSLDWT